MHHLDMVLSHRTHAALQLPYFVVYFWALPMHHVQQLSYFMSKIGDPLLRQFYIFLPLHHCHASLSESNQNMVRNIKLILETMHYTCLCEPE